MPCPMAYPITPPSLLICLSQKRQQQINRAGQIGNLPRPMLQQSLEREASDQLATSGLGAGALHEVHEPITGRQQVAPVRRRSRDTDAVTMRRHRLWSGGR